MAALDIAIVGPAIPAIRTHFGVSDRMIGWVFNTFVLCNLTGVPLMSKVADLFGRRNVFVFTVLLFGLGSLAVAVAPSMSMLLFGRGMQGLGASGIFPVAAAVVGDAFEVEKRGRALGLLGAVFGIAFMVGPLLAGALLLVGWQWLFFVNVPLAIVVVFLGYLLLPSTRQEPKSLDWPGIVVLGLMLFALAYGINSIDTAVLGTSLRSTRVWPLLALPLLLFPIFIFLEKRTSEPLLRLSMFQNSQVALACLFAVGAGLAEAAFIFFPAMAVSAFAVSDSTASLMLLPLMIAIAVGSPLWGRILDRVGSRAVALLSMILTAQGLGIVGSLTLYLPMYYVGSILLGLGLAGLLGSALGYILLNETRVTERTVGQGLLTLFISIGQIFGTAMIGAVVASSSGGYAGYLKAFQLIAFIALIMAVFALKLKRRSEELGTG